MEDLRKEKKIKPTYVEQTSTIDFAIIIAYIIKNRFKLLLALIGIFTIIFPGLTGTFIGWWFKSLFGNIINYF